MGDRAQVYFADEVTGGIVVGELSPGVYLHWGRSTVLKDLVALRGVMVGRGSDAAYASARFAGIQHALIPGNLSLGLLAPPTPGRPNLTGAGWRSGDAEVFVVCCKSWKCWRGNPDTFRGLDFIEPVSIPMG